jgi:hypothetical protein
VGVIGRGLFVSLLDLSGDGLANDAVVLGWLVAVYGVRLTARVRGRVVLEHVCVRAVLVAVRPVEQGLVLLLRLLLLLRREVLVVAV